jgi:phosphatidylserine decarboxylase
MKSIAQQASRRKIRREQWSQAKSIHGGLLKMLAASFAVRISRVPIPSKSLRRKVFSFVYGNKYPPLLPEELEQPLVDYPSLNALFTRGVPKKLRPIDSQPLVMVSPCDGTVQSVGKIAEHTTLIAKGVEYPLCQLAPDSDVSTMKEGCYAVIFLSPRDCHRVFMPDDGTLHAATHIPGARLLVHPSHQSQEYPVFSLNERLVMEFSSERGPFWIIMVAGWGVGHITHPFAMKLKAQANSSRRTLVSPRTLSRGEWLATFELGSTVILLAAQHVADELLVAPGAWLPFGSRIFQRSATPLPNDKRRLDVRQ